MRYPSAEHFELGSGQEHVVTQVLLARHPKRASHRHEAFGAPQEAQVMHEELCDSHEDQEFVDTRTLYIFRTCIVLH